MHLLGGVEAGGTKFVCAVGTGPDDIRAEIRFNTTTPEENLAQVIRFFQEHHAQTPLAAVGVAAFGPLDPDPSSPTFGYITTTPKPGWAHTDVVGPLREALGVPVGFDSDVNGAALGEHRWGAAQGLDTFVYITVGTGLGGGGMVNGKLMHGLMHPEMGHMQIPHDWDADPYPGFCTYHGDCWEGLACGPAIQDRWQFPAEELPPGHPSWHLEAHYLALGLVNIICLLSPQRIIMGGGVMQQRHLFPKIHEKVRTLLNNYIQKPAITEHIEEYIVPPALGGRAGVLGALALAEAARAGAPSGHQQSAEKS
ncbi:ROK family protein [Litorilinea aerophila]|uniref:fructokinase n=1 Tax=Litorilinea aerophila TaxID=1204385 RepID=A0A540VKX2_9CHLR|nr:ROK family protein [Litorilinea aerophila]MCC9075056.1 ROK family protein [Litorilinea aerophila]GIV79842.1 MAG: fructokinase [Litorilinea sp.]